MSTLATDPYAVPSATLVEQRVRPEDVPGLIVGQWLALLAMPLQAIAIALIVIDPQVLLAPGAALALAGMIASIVGVARVARGLGCAPREVATYLLLIVLTPLGPFLWWWLHLQALRALDEAGVPVWWLGATVGSETALQLARAQGRTRS